MRIRTILTGAVLVAASAAAAQAQVPYWPYANPYNNPAVAAPPAWSYDPYTSGMAPCPQWRPGDLNRCAQQMPPTYGQPNFWTHWGQP